MRRLMTAAALSLSLAAPALAEPAPRSLTLTATGEVTVVPDIAQVMVGASADAPTATEALAMTSARVAAAIKALEGAGVARRDIATSGLTLGPVYSDYQKITGYRADNALTVTARDLGGLGKLLDTLAEVGANEFRGITFDKADKTAETRAARIKAVGNAREIAETLATAAGVQLGPIQSITEGGSNVQPRMFARAEASVASAPVPVAEGELSIQAYVTVVWELR